MLILTRRISEAILAGPNFDIEFKILGITRNQVRIGINAPKEVPVHRKEIVERIIRGEKKKSIHT